MQGMVQTLADRLAFADSTNSPHAWERVEQAVLGLKEIRMTLLRVVPKQHYKNRIAVARVTESKHGRPTAELWQHALVGAAHGSFPSTSVMQTHTCNEESYTTS